MGWVEGVQVCTSRGCRWPGLSEGSVSTGSSSSCGGRVGSTGKGYDSRLAVTHSRCGEGR